MTLNLLKQLFGGVLSNSAARLQRCALGMSQFNYIFENIKGEDNVNDDCLIRSPHKETVNIEEPYTLMFVTKSFEMSVAIVDINKHTDTHTTLFA